MTKTREDHPWKHSYRGALVACFFWAAFGVGLPWVNYGLAVGGFTVPSDLTADARMAEEQSVQTMREVTRFVAILLSVISGFIGICGVILLWPAAHTAQAALLRIQRWRQLIALNATLLVVRGQDVGDASTELRCWGMSAHSAVGAVVVVVDVPDSDRRVAGVFTLELSGVQQFFGQDSLVALHLPVVSGRVGPGLLVARAVADDSHEVA